VDDRACLTGIVFVLQSGIPWEMLPQEMGCGSGMTCWRRLRYWKRRGVWKKLLRLMSGIWWATEPRPPRAQPPAESPYRLHHLTDMSQK
jgi:transposase